MSAGTPSLELPLSVLVALWLPTVRDEVSARRAAESIRAGEHPPRVHHSHGSEFPETSDSTQALATMLHALAPAQQVAAVLPRPGDLMGSPATCSADLLEAGEGVVVLGAAGAEARVAIPHIEVFGSALESGEIVHWRFHRLHAEPASASRILGGIESVAHARREITRALTDAVEILEALDVARERPDLADDVLDLSLAHLDAQLMPPDLDTRTLDLLERSARLLGIVELAQSDTGAAVTAVSIDTRAGALGEIARQARHALAAASAHRV
ncbi:hypothetical protein [Bogoriella caseilytica]|uniref:Uncharacterized protein n=1 Tax=Bogoriella caseilytica TaxID=56055 RepID=A0A3N2BG74_9MICO|nr:hypothetical protein [Bogoriella caseilytica]ROR74263.1 hypothetical protein EDD31_2667 [Bogoriella caseilytica]